MQPARHFGTTRPAECAANVACCAASGTCIAWAGDALASASWRTVARSAPSVFVARLSPVQQLADNVGREATPGQKSCLPDASGCISRRFAEAAGPHHFRALQFRLAQTLGIRSIEREAMLGELTADAQVAESLLPREDPGLDEALSATRDLLAGLVDAPGLAGASPGSLAAVGAVVPRIGARFPARC